MYTLYFVGHPRHIELCGVKAVAISRVCLLKRTLISCPQTNLSNESKQVFFVVEILYVCCRYTHTDTNRLRNSFRKQWNYLLKISYSYRFIPDTSSSTLIGYIALIRRTFKEQIVDQSQTGSIVRSLPSSQRSHFQNQMQAAICEALPLCKCTALSDTGMSLHGDVVKIISFIGISG